MREHRRQATIYMALGLGWIVVWLLWMSGPLARYFSNIGELLTGGGNVWARDARATTLLSLTVGSLVFMRGLVLYLMTRPPRPPRIKPPRPASRW